MADKPITYEDVYLIFSRKNLKEKAFTNLDSGSFWEDVKSASWMSHRSPEVKKSFEELKQAIILYSAQLGMGGTGFEQLFNDVQKLYPQFKADVDAFTIRHEKQRMKNNRIGLFLIIVLPPSLYFVDLAVESSSLNPSDWYWVFKEHLRAAGKFLISVLWCILVLFGLFSFVNIYKFIDSRFPKKSDMYENNSMRIFPASISIVVVFIGMMVVRNGILGTFGIDLLPH